MKDRTIATFAAHEPLRPATAPGEDRNLGVAFYIGTRYLKLRPATAPGEDRNRSSAM